MKTIFFTFITASAAAPSQLLAHGAHGASPEKEELHVLAHLITFFMEHPIVSLVALLALTGLVIYRKLILNAVRA